MKMDSLLYNYDERRGRSEGNGTRERCCGLIYYPTVILAYPSPHNSPHSLRIQLGKRNLIIMPELHILRIRLEKLQVKLLHHSRDHQRQFRVCKVDPNAAPSAFVERHLILASRGALGPQPTVRIEGPRVREDGFVGVRAEGCRAHGRGRRDGVGFVLQGFGGRDAADAGCDAEGETLDDTGFDEYANREPRAPTYSFAKAN